MTYEDLRRLARQTNWEKSRLLHILLKKVFEIIDEDDFVNAYVKHLFSDDNDELELYILSEKEKLIVAKYILAEKATVITILDTADIESVEVRTTEETQELTMLFNGGDKINFNSCENWDCDHKNYITDFARSLYKL
jgi:hypothetical protein